MNGKKKEERRVPKLRFPGFTEDWEQRKLGEVFIEYSEKKHEELPPLTIIQGIGTILRDKSDRQLQYDRKSLSGYKMVKKDDFIVHLRSFEGGLEKANSDGIISPAYHTFHGDNTDSRFYYPFFRSRRFIDVLLKPHVYGIRDGKSIDIEGMKSILIPAPTYEEQKMIGSYMESLDNLITLHQRKLENLKEMKKGLLQKMFPKNNEKVPELRFPGFTEDWEQRKLGEVATYRRGSFPQPYGKREWYDGNGAMPFVQVADVSDEMNLVEDTKQKISILAQPMSVFAKQNSVLVTLQGSIGRVAIMQYEAFVDRTILIFEKYKVEVDKTFWAYIIKQKFIDEARKAPGGTIKTITKEALSDFDLSIPKYQEQKQIGTYLRNLDHLITLHQRKLDNLKELKKGLLQQMFV